jgi:hypothetical protein
MSRTAWLATGTLVLGAALLVRLLTGASGAAVGGEPLERPGDSTAGDLAQRTEDDGHGGEADAPGLRGEGTPPAPPRRREVGDVEVEVVGAGDVPLANQWVTVFDRGGVLDHVATSSDGHLLLRALPLDGGVALALGWHDAPPARTVAVTGRRARLVAPDVLTLAVNVVDAHTGGPLASASWALKPAPGLPPPTPVPSGERLAVRHSPGVYEQIAYDVVAPRGFVAFDEPTWNLAVSRYTRELVAVHPLRREAEVSVTVFEEPERPATGVTVAWFEVAGRERRSPPTGVFLLGGFHLLGVPWFREEPLRFLVETSEGRRVLATVVLPEEPHVTAEVTLTAAEPEGEVPEPAPRAPLADLPPPLDRGFGQVPSAGDVPPEHLGSIALLVLDAAGDPVPAARVLLPAPGEHRTKGDGTLRVDGIPAGDYRLLLAEPGLVPTSAEVAVPPGKAAEVTIREGVGGTVDVKVKDPRGRPLPFARVRIRTLSGLPWVDLVDRVQRLDDFTDAAGTRRLDRVEPGGVVVRASWAGRTGEAEATVREGERTTVEVVVPGP